MATSGSLYSSQYNDRGIVFSWERSSYSSSANTTTISWTLKGAGSHSGYYVSGNFYVSINGDDEYYSSTRINLYEGTTIVSGTKTINMNNDGSGSFSVYIEAGIFTVAVNVSGSDTFTLDTIPRYPTGTSIALVSKTPTSITFKLTANENCSAFDYKIGSSGSWVHIPISSNRKTVTHTITGLTPGTGYSIYGDFKRADSGQWSSWNNDTPRLRVTTTGLGIIVTAPDFNDEQNVLIEYTNEYGENTETLQACISLIGSSDNDPVVPYRNISKTERGLYTFEFTNAERTALQNATSGNSRTVKFIIKSTLNNNSYYSVVDKTLTIINANPTFSNFEYEDTNNITTGLTGNNQIVIKNYNDIEITISTNNKAIANKGATMVKYRAVCGNLSDEQPYSDNSDVVLNLNNIVDRTITVYVVDSRDNTTAKSIVIEVWKDYTDIIFTSGSIARTGGASTESTLTFEGTMWKTDAQYDFGAQANQITYCKYQFKKLNEPEESYSDLISIVPTVSGSNPAIFTFNAPIIGDEGDGGVDGFNLENSYNIRIFIKDQLSTSRYEVLLGVGLPLMAIAPTGIAFGAGYDDSIGGIIQYPGSIIVTGEEIETTQFLDGNKIYMKRIDCGALPNNNTKDVSTGLSIDDVHLVKITGMAYRSYDNAFFGLPYSAPSSANTISCFGVTRDGIVHVRLTTGIDRSNVYETFVDVYYIKN